MRACMVLLDVSKAKLEKQKGPTGTGQRYEETVTDLRRSADPTDPGDAADLSIMGYCRETCLAAIAISTGTFRNIRAKFR